MNLLTLAASTHGLCWAIEPQRGQALLADYRLDGAEPERFEPAAFSMFGRPPRDDDRPYRMVDGVALIPLVGAMTKGRSWYCSGTSTAIVRAMVGQAAADDKVKAILVYCDSPGGSVDGVQELADTIAAVSRKKPVTTFFEDCGASAAYWGLCTSSRVLMNAAGLVGSLGIMMMLVDSSKAAEEAGLDFILLSTGPLKGRGSGPLPIDPATKAMYQRVVDDHGERFSSTVARGRKLSAERMKDVFTGDVFNAAAAQRLGLVDAVATLDEAVADLVAGIGDGGDEAEARALLSVPGRAAWDPPAAASVAPPVSAPGGRPGSAGISKAPPPAGAEKQPTGNPLMSFRQAFSNLMGAKGFGRIVDRLQATQSEDPEVLARIVTDNVEAQAQELHDRNPILATLRAQGVTDHEGLDRLLARARNGDTYLRDVRTEAKQEAVRALGADDAAPLTASIDNMGLTDALAYRAHYRSKADARVGIDPATGAAPERQTASTAVGVVEGAGGAKRPFERLDERTQATIRAQAGDDVARQDRMAADYLKTLDEVPA